MITCPSCNHQNPEGSLQCENCYTPLPATTSCPNCGASVQTDATFCGQCGFNLQAENSSSIPLEETAIGSLPKMSLEETSLRDEIPLARGTTDIMPETAMSSPIQSPWDENEHNSNEDEVDLSVTQAQEQPLGFSEVETNEINETTGLNPQGETEFTEIEPDSVNKVRTPWELQEPDFVEPTVELERSETIPKLDLSEPDEEPPVSKTKTSLEAVSMSAMSGATQLQIQKASLLHLQSNTTIEIPSNLDVVHLGKPNGQIPPDIDVAGFPDSEVVSRVHADIRIEGDAYYLEDVGSSNGTYVNHAPLLQGNRHRLRAGDRVSLGKGDLVTFIFQLG